MYIWPLVMIYLIYQLWKWIYVLNHNITTYAHKIYSPVLTDELNLTSEYKQNRWLCLNLVLILVSSYSFIVTFLMIMEIPLIFMEGKRFALAHEGGIVIVTLLFLGMISVTARCLEIPFNHWPKIHRILSALVCGRRKL